MLKSTETRNSFTQKIQDTATSVVPNNKSNIVVQYCYIDEYGTTVIALSGGLNGCGNWSNYFKDLCDVMKSFSTAFDRVWLISLENDCPDDVFWMKVGISADCCEK